MWYYFGLGDQKRPPRRNDIQRDLNTQREPAIQSPWEEMFQTEEMLSTKPLWWRCIWKVQDKRAKFVAAQTCNRSTWEAETGWSTGVWGQLGIQWVHGQPKLHSKILFQGKTNEETNQESQCDWRRVRREVAGGELIRFLVTQYLLVSGKISRLM